MLLESSSLTARWTELLSIASRVDIAVAWITHSDRIDDLVTFAAAPGHQVRAIVGVGDYLTSPSCLRRLHGAGLVKIGIGEQGCTFHPKLYLFTLRDCLVCWVGSANLTMSGFGRNTELVHKYLDDGTTAAWFARAWGSYEYPTLEWLDEYEKRAGVVPKPSAVVQMPAPGPPADPLDSWPAYYAALWSADKKWATKHGGKMGIFTGQNSYLLTLRTARPLIAKDWATLSTTEGRVLLGLVDGDTDYGLLVCKRLGPQECVLRRNSEKPEKPTGNPR